MKTNHGGEKNVGWHCDWQRARATKDR